MTDGYVNRPGTISPTELADRLNSGTGETTRIAIVDVRDNDYIGGHIRGSLHLPHSQLDQVVKPTDQDLTDASLLYNDNTSDITYLQQLVSRLAPFSTVIFHCSLSQQRGPNTAMRYLTERNRLKKHLSTLQPDISDKLLPMNQEVLILAGGFSRWQSLFGEDQHLTSDYNKEIWRAF